MDRQRATRILHLAKRVREFKDKGEFEALILEYNKYLREAQLSYNEMKFNEDTDVVAFGNEIVGDGMKKVSEIVINLENLLNTNPDDFSSSRQNNQENIKNIKMEDAPQKTRMDKVKDHPLIFFIIAFVIGVTSTWKVSEEIRVKPKLERIDKYKEQLSALKDENIALVSKTKSLKALEYLRPTPISGLQVLFMNGLIKYQDKNGLNKVVIGRNGELYEDSLNVISLFLNKDPSVFTPKDLDSVIISIPEGYIRLIPETRMDSPWVLTYSKYAKEVLR